MRECLETGFLSAIGQMCVGVLSFVLLGYLLHLVGTRLKTAMADLSSGTQRMLVIPGEFFRNVGISIACLVTGVKMRRHVISDDTTGSSASLTHANLSAGTPTGFIRNLIVQTSPIWFGSLILVAFVLVAGGAGLMPDVRAAFTDGDMGLFKYATLVFWEATSLLGSLVCVWNWTSPFFLFCLICFVSVATEVTIDSHGIWSIKAGLFGLFVVLVVLNAIPGVTSLIAALGRTVRPALFALHVILLFVVLFDLVVALFLWMLVRIFRRGNRSGNGK